MLSYNGFVGFGLLLYAWTGPTFPNGILHFSHEGSTLFRTGNLHVAWRTARTGMTIRPFYSNMS